jgi:hypothetical protein
MNELVHRTFKTWLKKCQVYDAYLPTYQGRQIESSFERHILHLTFDIFNFT